MFLKYDINLACRVIIKEHLERLNIPFYITDLGTVEINGILSFEKSEILAAELKKYGIELIDNSESILVQQIKEAIYELVYRFSQPSQLKLSEHVANKLNLSYSYLSKVFSEEMGISIENYMIMQRVERVKQLLAENRLTITEIAWKLNYSSVAHLSNQFKKITGITPTFYQQIVNKNKSRIKNHMHKLPVKTLENVST